QQAGTFRGKWLLSARIASADVLAEPQVVHVVDLVDQDETRLCVVVGGTHDQVPQFIGLDGGNHFTLDSALFVRLVLGLNHRPVTVDDFLDRDTLAFREGELPVTAGLHGVHKLVGDQQAPAELTQTAIFTLGFDELFYVRMADIEPTHLRTTPATGRANGEAHLVNDVHECQGTIGAGASTRDVRPTVAQRREFVTDTATGLQ